MPRADNSLLDVQQMKKNSILLGIALAGLIVILVYSAGCSEAGEKACEALSGSDKDHCYQNLARASGDDSLCDKIAGAGPASKCFAYIASDQENLIICETIEEMPWHHDREAYRYQDCILYVARNNNCPECCSAISQDYYGSATDLNPYMEVTRAKCISNIPCGKSGQPACRSASGGGVNSRGTPGAYYCYSDNQTRITYADPPSSC